MCEGRIENSGALDLCLSSLCKSQHIDSYILTQHTVSYFSYAPFFQGPRFLTKMLESNILYDNLFIDILSV